MLASHRACPQSGGQHRITGINMSTLAVFLLMLTSGVNKANGECMSYLH